MTVLIGFHYDLSMSRDGEQQGRISGLTVLIGKDCPRTLLSVLRSKTCPDQVQFKCNGGGGRTLKLLISSILDIRISRNTD